MLFDYYFFIVLLRTFNRMFPKWERWQLYVPKNTCFTRSLFFPYKPVEFVIFSNDITNDNNTGVTPPPGIPAVAGGRAWAVGTMHQGANFQWYKDLFFRDQPKKPLPSTIAAIKIANFSSGWGRADLQVTPLDDKIFLLWFLSKDFFVQL